MWVLFPCDPTKRFRVDSEFVRELEAAKSVGFSTFFYSHEALEGGSLEEALKHFPEPGADGRVILRGWMITGEQYRDLYEGLRARGFLPSTTPEAYEQAHYLPYSYPLLEGHTAISRWISGVDPDRAWEMFAEFQERGAIIKDWVKSAKHRWNEACFIPAETGRERFMEIFSNFRVARGHLFNRGVVLRAFAPFAKRGSDIRGYPLVHEFRLFYWNGTLLVRPVETAIANPLGEKGRWDALAAKFESPFIALDVAMLEDQSWVVVEAGDGGVSGLPLAIDEQIFFASLWNHALDAD